MENSSFVRSAELETAFSYLVDKAGSADFTGIDDPNDQWLLGLRTMMEDYGNVGNTIDMSGITISPVIADGVPAEWVTHTDSRDSHRIVYIHGGGWAGGHPDGYRALSTTLARLSGASILMVDYRLSPEHPYPAGLDDCVTAFKWAVVNGPKSGQKGTAGADVAERIALGGDSAGGNLATATTLRLVQDGARLPSRLAVIAGTLDNHRNESRVGIDDIICTEEAFLACNRAYLGGNGATDDPFVSPVFADDKWIAKFPPTLLQVSSIEALLWDSKRFSERLEKNAVRYNLSVWPGMPHVWHAFIHLFPEARRALSEIAHFLTDND